MKYSAGKKNQIETTRKLLISPTNQIHCLDANRITMFMVLYRKSSTRIQSGGRKFLKIKNDNVNQIDVFLVVETDWKFIAWFRCSNLTGSHSVSLSDSKSRQVMTNHTNKSQILAIWGWLFGKLIKFREKRLGEADWQSTCSSSYVHYVTCRVVHTAAYC